MDSKVLFKRFFLTVGIVFMPCFACVSGYFGQLGGFLILRKPYLEWKRIFKWIPHARNFGKFE